MPVSRRDRAEILRIVRSADATIGRCNAALEWPVFFNFMQILCFSTSDSLILKESI